MTTVIQFPKNQNQPPGAKLSDADKRKIVETAEQIREIFKPLTTKPILASQDSPDGTGPALGPYKMPILYPSKGSPKHMAGQYIDKLRGLRRYTHNCIELRCDALGLVMYVAAVNQVKEGKVQAKIRVVAYDFDRVEPTFHVLVGNHIELTNKLYTTLNSTYNRLSREYNLGGLDPQSLILKSQHKDIPDIPLVHL